MQQIQIPWFAAVYGADNYSECAYSSAVTCQTQSGSSQQLANTGAPVSLCAGIAITLIMLGVVLLLRIRKQKVCTRKTPKTPLI